MKFSELQDQLKEKFGIDHLADIARELGVSPQAVSNWKARDRERGAWSACSVHAFALSPLAGQLVRATDRFGLFPGTFFRGLLIGPTPLHLPEDPFTLHFFLERTKRLINVIVSDVNLDQLRPQELEFRTPCQGMRLIA